MVNEGTGLPVSTSEAIEVKPFRELGFFKDEVKLMFERMEKAKPFPKDEVILLGMGTTRVECPFDAETWSVNMGYMQTFQLDGHFTRIILTHTQVKDVYGRGAFNWEHFNKLAEAGIKVYNTHKVKGLNSTMYPFKRITKKFNTDYFSNTFAYMIAMALDEGYKKIRLFGCDMMTQSEYAWEKGGMEYWLGLANGMGVKCEITEGSTLLKTITGKPYGVKYFKMKDIDPTGLLRRRVKKFVGKPTSTGYMYDNPVRPPDPDMMPYVSIQTENFNVPGNIVIS